MRDVKMRGAEGATNNVEKCGGDKRRPRVKMPSERPCDSTSRIFLLVFRFPFSFLRYSLFTIRFSFRPLIRLPPADKRSIRRSSRSLTRGPAATSTVHLFRFRFSSPLCSLCSTPHHSRNDVLYASSLPLPVIPLTCHHLSSVHSLWNIRRAAFAHLSFLLPVPPIIGLVFFSSIKIPPPSRRPVLSRFPGLQWPTGGGGSSSEGNLK